MLQDDGRNKWLEVGWKRGAVVDVKNNEAIYSALPEALKEQVDGQAQAYFIPVLYDCALVEERFEIEPWAQGVVCWPCEADGNYKFGKNPRKYHFHLENEDGQVDLEVKAISFCQIEREMLLGVTSPMNDWQWPEYGLDKLLNWISERYRQPTFPDEWNDRMKAKEGLLKKLWGKKDFVELCSGVYLKIEPFAEIEAEDTYGVSAFITVPEGLKGQALRDFTKNKGPALVQKLSGILNSLSNVNVGNVDTINEDQFTKAMERDYRRWQLENYSYKEEPLAPLPSELEVVRGNE